MRLRWRPFQRQAKQDRWVWDVERLNSLALDRKVALRYQKGRQQFMLQLTAPPLDAGRLRRPWRSRCATRIRWNTWRRQAPGWLNDNAYGLIPTWESCELQTDARARDIVETGARFLCRAPLASYPAYLLMLRGVRTKPLLNRFLPGAVDGFRHEVAQARAAYPEQRRATGLRLRCPSCRCRTPCRPMVDRVSTLPALCNSEIDRRDEPHVHRRRSAALQKRPAEIDAYDRPAPDVVSRGRSRRHQQEGRVRG